MKEGFNLSLLKHVKNQKGIVINYFKYFNFYLKLYVSNILLIFIR